MLGEEWERKESIEIAWDIDCIKMGLVVLEVLWLFAVRFSGVKSQFVTLLANRINVSVCAEGFALRDLMWFESDVKALSKKFIVGGWVCAVGFLIL